MSESRIFRIPYSWPRPESLAWEGDALVDWVGGGRRWLADGTLVDRPVSYGYDFDRALVSPSGRHAVLYCDRQTKGLILDQGRIVREIDRSYYQAHAYAYPVALGRLPDGREVIAHCPDEYNLIEIETLDGGERLTRRAAGEAQDVFHSRLAFSPDGRFLLSAGWVWQPWNCFAAYDVERVLADPGLLDLRDGPFELQGSANNGEVRSACWLDSTRLLVTTDLESADADDEEPPCSGIWDVRAGGWSGRSTAWNPQASQYACGGGAAYVEDGRPCWWAPGMEAPLVWPEIAAIPVRGERPTYGIVHDAPLLAAHPTAPRFAVATEEEIVVVEVG